MGNPEHLCYIITKFIFFPVISFLNLFLIAERLGIAREILTNRLQDSYLTGDFSMGRNSCSDLNEII